MRRLWGFIALVAGIAVVISLITRISPTSPVTKAVGKVVALITTKPAPTKRAEDPIPVLTARSRQDDVPVYVEGVGTGKALNSVLIRSQVDGTLMALNFEEGQDVKVGDVIAKIDPRLYQATLDENIAKKAQDEAILANAKRDLQRYGLLIKTKAVTQQQYDTQVATVAQNQAQVQIDQALIDSARTTLGYTDIRSPIAGRTGIRDVDVGNLIHASDTTGIVTVAQIQPISVIFNVPQQDLPRISKASLLNQLDVQATDSDWATVDDPKGALADDHGRAPVVDHGRLVVVDNTIDQTTGTVKLRANFPNKELSLWPGIFVNVRLKVETLRDAIVIPVAALQRGPKGAYVFTAVDGKAVMNAVTIGQQDDMKAVVTKGLKGNEVVITSGFQKLTDGALINPSPDASAAASSSAPPALHEPGVSPPAPDAKAPLPPTQPAAPRPGTTE